MLDGYRIKSTDYEINSILKGEANLFKQVELSSRKPLNNATNIFPYFGVWRLIGYESNENKPNQINGQNSKWQMTSKQARSFMAKVVSFVIPTQAIKLNFHSYKERKLYCFCKCVT